MSANHWSYAFRLQISEKLLVIFRHFGDLSLVRVCVCVYVCVCVCVCVCVLPIA